MPIVVPFTASDVQIKSVLVATDFSPASEKPLRHAVAIARHYGADFFLMHVVSSLGFTLVGPDAAVTAAELAWRDARQVEHKLVASGDLAGLCHQVIVRDGDIWTELEEVIRQEGIDMVVVGTHSRKGLAKLVLGSVAEQIFRHASCLVLTVGPNSPAEADIETTGAARPLLFPTDFGEGSSRALPYAISFAKQRGTRLVLLHMLSPVPKVEGNRWYTPRDVEQMREDQQSAARRRLKELIGRTAASHVETVFMVEFGEPAGGILRAAEALHAEAIVMGLNRKAHLEIISHLPRSTAYEVVRRAGCPVLTVRN
jgi:nucleotide-binding universal stress UspA family protein